MTPEFSQVSQESGGVGSGAQTPDKPQSEGNCWVKA